MNDNSTPNNNSNNSHNGGGPRRSNNRRRHHNRPKNPSSSSPEASQSSPSSSSSTGQRPPREGQAQGSTSRHSGQRHPQNSQNPQRHPPRDQQGGHRGGQSSQQNNSNARRRPHSHQRSGHGNAPRQNHPPGFSLERIYEKYLNLLDQHIIARRKYHDFFYRADPAQKIKLEKNFYNTLNDVRDFEDKLAPDVKEQFEKRNNGYRPDRTYTSNREMPVEGDVVPADLPPAEPHFLQSQKACDYSEDREESVGTAEDYLRYKQS